MMNIRILITSALAMTSMLFSQNVTNDINTFGFKLAKPLQGEEANTIYSPYSLFSCFSMVASGAQGTTKEALEAGLQWSQDREKTAKQLGELFNQLSAHGEKEDCLLQIKSANGLFASQDTPLLPSFESLVENDYHAEAQTLDFSNAQQATQIINTWVGNETLQKIRDLLQPGDVDTSTRLVLVNSLYFQGAWQKKFSKKSTVEKPFFVNEKRSVPVPMMRQTNTFRYFDDANVQVVILPLCSVESIQPSLMIVLPKIPGNLSHVSERMSNQNLKNYLTASSSQTLDLQMPSFCLRKRYDLQNVLSSLGMGVAFTDSADFSDIDGMKDLYLSKALHEGYFDLNEEGIEAAAATAAIINVTSGTPSKKEPASFVADHPFLFFLIDEKSGVLLFAGKLSNPNPSQGK